jgi:hypothetical protein
MRREIPIETIYGQSSGHTLVLEIDGEVVTLKIDGGFAGRDVDEELPKSALLELTSGGPQKNSDLLGLTLQTDGGELIKGSIGVGSGNQGFAIRKSDLIEALG